VINAAVRYGRRSARIAAGRQIQVGQKVSILDGPLAGVEGTVAISKGESQRVVLTVPLLQRSVAVEIDRSWVVRIA